LQKTLFGVGGVQGLEGKTHRRRKALFLEFMSQARIDGLLDLVERTWQARMPHWQSGSPIVLLDELHRILCRAACDWCGIALKEKHVSDWTRALVLMIEGGGSFGPRHWEARRARRRTENALMALIDDYRRDPGLVDPALPLPAFADFRDENGTRLASRTVAVELLNLIRPIVAVARYMVFSVLAIHDHPACLETLKQPNNDSYRRAFIQEVRRYYPFFPFLVARVRDDFVWYDYRFPRGRQVVLDLYGTNHDPNRWDEPHRFSPERFEQESDSCHRFATIPQGGGEHTTGHRCPGEWITLALIDLAVEKFVNRLSYRIPAQDLSLNFTQMPSKPRSGLVIEKIDYIN
jgi:fatty-acid peroxygenase